MKQLDLVLIKISKRMPKLDKPIKFGIVCSLIVIGGITIAILPHKIDPGFYGYQTWKDLKPFFWVAILILGICLTIRYFNKYIENGFLVLMEKSIKSNWIENDVIKTEEVKSIEYTYFEAGSSNLSSEQHWIKIISKEDRLILNSEFDFIKKNELFIDYLECYQSTGIDITLNGFEDQELNLDSDFKSKIDWLKDGGFTSFGY